MRTSSLGFSLRSYVDTHFTVKRSQGPSAVWRIEVKLDPRDITPGIMCVNEDYWIYYTLRDLYKVFPQVIVLDTGSDDSTKHIIKTEYPKVTLIEESYGHDANLIGNGRNVLRGLCKTHWLFIVDGDEIWRKDNLLKIFEHEVRDDTGVVMLGLANVEDREGKLFLREHDYSNRDGLFCPEIRWTRTDYPFESYGLSGTFSMDRVHYLNAHEIYAYHVRHTQRSSRNNAAFFRTNKYNYFPYSGSYVDLPKDWIGKVNPKYPNPYLVK